MVTLPTKRRLFFRYLSLPLIVALVFVSVAELTALQRAEMVAKLADQVAHQETAEATVALRQLAAMPRPPLDVLVATATSDDSELAEQAQVLINGLLRRWQRRLDAGEGVTGIGRQLDALSSALAQHRQTFSSGDHRWLVATTQRILRMANQIPARHTPLVAQQCEAVLEAVAANEARVAQLIDRELTAQPLAPAGSTGAHAVADVQSLSTRPGESAQLAPDAVGPTAPSMSTSDPRVQDAMTRSAPGQTSAGMPPTRPRNASLELRPGRNLTWTQPLLNVAPAAGIHPPDDEGTSKSTASFRQDSSPPGGGGQPIPRPWARLDSRDLLHRWLLASDNEMAAIEEELNHRGFSRISDPLVEQFFSQDAAERLQLVDKLLTTPGVDARPWLALLADDADADVRLLTVTIMATSDDTELLDKACDVALRDRDPRIAGLASRLRERRDAAKRR